MSRFGECDTNLQLIGFPTTLGIQQTHTVKKSYEYKECENSSVCSGSLCTCRVTHSIEKCYACNQCVKILSSSVLLKNVIKLI